MGSDILKFIGSETMGTSWIKFTGASKKQANKRLVYNAYYLPTVSDNADSKQVTTSFLSCFSLAFSKFCKINVTEATSKPLRIFVKLYLISPVFYDIFK